MMPWDFYRLTPAEFSKLSEGYILREKLSRQRDAWMLANLLQPHVKKGKKLKTKDFLEEAKPALNVNTPEGKAFMNALVDGKSTDKEMKKVKFNKLMKKLKERDNG